MWRSTIITAVTSLASSNFLSTQSDACFHPIILIVHVADQDFTHGIIIQNSRLLHKSQVTISTKSLDFTGILFQVIRIHWNSLLMHSTSLEFSSKSSGFIGILFQHSVSLEFSFKSSGFIGNSLPTHSASLEFSSKSSGFIGNSLPTHSASLEFSSNALGFI